MEQVGKNYVVHELGQREGVRKPTWKDSMEAMFGKHVKWEELQVYYAKNRPFCVYTSVASRHLRLTDNSETSANMPFHGQGGAVLGPADRRSVRKCRVIQEG